MYFSLGNCVSLQETYEQRRKDYMGELQKREDEMRSSFIKKVKNKEAELKQEEQEVQLRFAVAAVHSNGKWKISTNYFAAPPTVLSSFSSALRQI